MILSSKIFPGHYSTLYLGNVKKTVYLVGKGITYDTGGADIKAGGVMAGMSRLDDTILVVG